MNLSCICFVFKQKGNCPKPCQANNRKNYAAEKRTLTAKNKAYKVEPEKPYGAPVQRPHYTQYQSDSIHVHAFLSFLSLYIV